MSKPVVQYVVKYGTVDGIDYNNDGHIDEEDVVVVKMVNGKEVGRTLLNKTTEDKMKRVIYASPVQQGDEMTRVVYNRMPPANAENPPPVVFKEQTEFGQYVKQGAGHELGAIAVAGCFELLGSLFSSGGGGSGRGRSRGRGNRKPTKKTQSKSK